MPTTLTSEDYDQIAKRVAKIMLKEQNDDSSTRWIGVKEFANELPIRKAPEWVRIYLLRGKPWAINVNPGKGHQTKINEQQGLRWVDQHMNSIDWNQPIPRG